MENNDKPNLVESYRILGSLHHVINIHITENADGYYEWENVHVPPGKWEYGGIVDALITYKYPNDKMQATINNYLLEPDNEEYVKAFNDMQAWRKEAKEIAKEALLYGMP